MKMIYKFSFFLLLTIPLISCSSDKAKPQSSTGEYKPFEIELLSGQILHSDSLAGKVVLVDYWATWCTPCIKEVPGYNIIYHKYRDQKFVFLPICMDSGDADRIKPFLDEFGINYPIYVGNSEAGKAFGDLPGYPATFLLDQKGKIQKKYVGISPTKLEEIDGIIAAFLGTN